MKTPIIMAPSWSFATQLSYISALEIMRSYIGMGIRPVFLKGLRATRPFSRIFRHIAAKEDPPHLFVYVGHGYSGSLVGSEWPGKKVPFLRPIDEYNIGLLKDYIVVSIACDSMSSLGPVAIEEGVTTYYGSSIPLEIIIRDIDHDGRMDFIDIFKSVPISLAMGASTGNAMDIMEKKIRGLLLKTELKEAEHAKLWEMLNTFYMIGEDVRWR